MGKLTAVTLDFETYWTPEFSLTKMSFIEYIKDPRFSVLSVSVRVGRGEPTFVGGHDQVGEYLRSFDWANCAAIAQNGNEFDFPLLVWVYDCHPAFFIDTTCMARPRHQSTIGASLKALSEHYKLPVKDGEILRQTQGKRFEDLDLREIASMIRYNNIDTSNTRELFDIFKQPDTDGVEDLRALTSIISSHKRELQLSDMTARMICYPQLQCDTTLLQTTLNQVDYEKDKVLNDVADELGLATPLEARQALMSNKQFAQVLEGMGVPAPRKISAKTGKSTFAFAKTDQAFLDLANHDNEVVQMMVAARLGTKSTLLQTRLAKMLACARLMGGWMPVPLAYHSATTGRWGGRVWNPQNLPRIAFDKVGAIIHKLSNALRLSLVAPPGHKVVVADSSGIELRVNHYLWSVSSTAQLYAKDPKADLYIEFAAFLFHVRPEDVTKEQRQVAKVAQLGLGFGAGPETFQKVAKIMGGVTLTLEESERIVHAWRNKYIEIVRGWTRCQSAVAAMTAGTTLSVDLRGLVKTAQGKCLLPSGRWLYYPELRRGVDPDKPNRPQYYYGTGNRGSKIYSGLMCENLVQAIARDVLAEAALAVHAKTGYWPAHTVHDELIYVVPDDKAEAHLKIVNEALRTPPSWLPGIVLWSEGGFAQSYGLAK